MGNFKLWRSFARVLVVSAAAFLLCGGALAQVNGFVVVNPIVVCDSSGANCPPFGALCSTNATTKAYTCTQSTSPSTATANTPIGFVDADTNINLTRAILHAQTGVDVAFLPVRQYNSPDTNVDPWPKITTTGAQTPYSTTTNPTNYQHIHLKNITCKDKTVVQASPDLAALTGHQICTEHGGVPAGVSNPPSSPSTSSNPVPLGSTLGQSNALDVFFVTDFPGNAVFGISWINGDGVSIGGPATFLVTGPRFDNLDHEIGHALALDHTTFGILTSLTPTLNLMATGSSRIVPSTSGCSPGPPIGPATVGSNKVSNPNGGVLYDLVDPSVYPCPAFSTLPNPLPPPAAEQVTPPSASGSTCTLSTCTDQVSALSLSPFIAKTLASAANAGGGTQTHIAGAATISSSTSSTDVPFEVDAPSGTGENGDSINSIIIALPNISGLSFSGSSPATQTGGVGGVNIIQQVRVNGSNAGGGPFGNPLCTPANKLPSFQCLQLFFSTGGPKGGGNAFVAGDSVKFNLALSKDVGTIQQNNLLDGTLFTVITSTVNIPTGYATTTVFGAFDPNTGFFSADSRFPDFTVPNQLDPKFVNAAVVKSGPKLSKCTPPYITVVSANGKQMDTLCPGGSVPSDLTCTGSQCVPCTGSQCVIE